MGEASPVMPHTRPRGDRPGVLPHAGWVPLVLVAAAVGCAGPSGSGAPRRAAEAHRASPPRPACDREVPAGASAQAALDAAAPGEVICLAPGEHPGPLTVARAVTLWGPATAVVRSSGEGTTIKVTGDGATLLGLTVDGSGGRFDVLDAAVHVVASDVRVEGVGVRRAVFGLLVEKADRVVLRHNEIQGTEEGPHGLRGDPIRLWETRHSRIQGNRVLAGRDVVIWYSSDNVIEGNDVESGRYGTHLMYSHGNRIEGNVYRRNVVGLFLMYSRDVVVRDNLLLASRGAAGVGLGVKESGNLRVEDNAFVQNTVGAYLDTTPVQMDHTNVFEGNTFAFSDTALIFHGTETRNTFRANTFRDNQDQVRVEGNADAMGVTWEGNAWDDYAGYDLDGDGVGDLPYEVRSLSGDLVGRRPQLAFLRGTAALWLLDAATHVAPLLAPRRLLVDARPAMRAPRPEVLDAR